MPGICSPVAVMYWPIACSARARSACAAGSGRAASQRVIVESLDDKNALAPGLDVDRATDVLWSLNLSNLWQLLGPKSG
jgi:hypothetical protein